MKVLLENPEPPTVPQANIFKTEPQFPEQQQEIQEAAPKRLSLVTSKSQIKLAKSNPELWKIKL